MPPITALALLYPVLFSSFSAPKNYVVFPDDNGVPNIVSLDIPPLTLEERSYIEENVHSVTFWLHTRPNQVPGEELINGDINTIKKSAWNPKIPTRFITHGWHGSRNTRACTVVRDAYLEVGGYNVIVIDWSKLSSSIMYGTVARSIPTVARYVSSFINFMENAANMDISTTKLIGHSLGGHLVSLAAKYSHKRIKQVVVLDPAKPYFDSVGPDDRVDSTHAKHVQVIHTNGGMLGLMEPYGTSDFYPNGGQRQPGCMLDFIGKCAHSRAYHYYAESVKNPKGFLGKAIERHSLSDYLVSSAYMGGSILDSNANGSYTLETASQPPFALG